MSYPAPQEALDAPANPIGYCFHCGYDLRGQTVQRCPECGFRYDATALHDLRESWCSTTLDALVRCRKWLLLVMIAAPLGLSIATTNSTVWFFILGPLGVLGLAALRVIAHNLDFSHGRNRRSRMQFSPLELAARTLLFFVTAAALAVVLGMAAPFLPILALTVMVVYAIALRLSPDHGRSKHRLLEGMPESILLLRRASAQLALVSVAAMLEAIAMLALCLA